VKQRPLSLSQTLTTLGEVLAVLGLMIGLGSVVGVLDPVALLGALGLTFGALVSLLAAAL
jgi:hypothetical protein